MAAIIICKQLYQVWKYNSLCDIYTEARMYISPKVK